MLCQARGCSAAAVLAELRAPGCNARMLRQLYAGCGSAALCSAAIGAVYLLAFYSAKRLGAAVAARGSAAAAPQQQQQAGGRKADAGSQLADGSAGHPPLSREGTHPLVASLAGVVASLAGSVFEAPMEMFKLRTQVGPAPVGAGGGGGKGRSRVVGRHALVSIFAWARCVAQRSRLPTRRRPCTSRACMECPPSFAASPRCPPPTAAAAAAGGSTRRAHAVGHAA